MSQLSQALSTRSKGPEGDESLGPDAVEHALSVCAAQLAKRFDAEFGGFGGAPK
jgi:uncharacterized protein YyaL (SSP411 family)